MNIKSLIFPVLIFIILVLSCLLYFTIKKSNFYQKTTEEYNVELLLYKHDKKNSKEIFSRQIFSEYKYLDSTIIISDVRNKKIPLKELIDTPKLIYRFSETSCMPCVLNDASILNELSDSIGVDNIILISKFDKINRLKIFHNQNGLKYRSYNYTNRFGISLETDTLRESPFFFILNPEMKIQFAYNTLPDHSIKSPYFKRILQYFMDK